MDPYTNLVFIPRTGAGVGTMSLTRYEFKVTGDFEATNLQVLEYITDVTIGTSETKN